MAAFVSRYARAFADVVASAHLDTAAIDRQLDDFLATWDGSANSAKFCKSGRSRRRKKWRFSTSMNKRLGMQRELRNLIAVLINNDRIAQIHEVVAGYRAELQQRMGIRQAEIVTARELSDQERTSLLAGVGRLAGAQVDATFKLDKSILGGTVVRIGSTVYDGSVRGRLERLKEALVAG